MTHILHALCFTGQQGFAGRIMGDAEECER